MQPLTSEQHQFNRTDGGASENAVLQESSTIASRCSSTAPDSVMPGLFSQRRATLDVAATSSGDESIRSSVSADITLERKRHYLGQ
ncbi:hypothetical protein IOCL1545_000387700 [Leishmania shawi]|uniref:Uncharacterized protein n=1 Tax=Leishmania shawi TaxID=5680 RepID=A0ABR3E6S5_9TRYP